MHKKLIDLEIITRPLGQSDYLLTNLALFYEPGEIGKTTIQTGYKKRYVVYNVDNLRDILRYNMPLSELYENMYPEDAIADAPREDEDPDDGYWEG